MSSFTKVCSGSKGPLSLSNASLTECPLCCCMPACPHSSGEGEEGREGSWAGIRPPASSEDEFERELEKELMGVLVGMASPDVLAAAAQDNRGQREGRGTRRGKHVVLLLLGVFVYIFLSYLRWL